MNKNSLGLIETYGLLEAVVAADVAVKSANVVLVGYELSRGSGRTTVKIEGDVGAVRAAIDAAVTAVMKVGKVASMKVIPRPASGLEGLVRNDETVGFKPSDDDSGTPELQKTPMATPSKGGAEKDPSGAGGDTKPTSNVRLEPVKPETSKNTSVKMSESSKDTAAKAPSAKKDAGKASETKKGAGTKISKKSAPKAQTPSTDENKKTKKTKDIEPDRKEDK